MKTLSEIIKNKIIWFLITGLIVGFIAYKCLDRFRIHFINPELSSSKVVEMMQEQGGLLNDSPKELLRAVRWYVFRGDEEVIRQLIRNIEYEQEVVLPEERDDGSSFNSTIDVRGRTGWILHNQRGLYKKLGYVLHQELWRYAQIETSPHLIYSLMKYVNTNTPDDSDVDHDPRCEWYDPDVRDQDVLAYLRIYATYKEWPSIRRHAKAVAKESISVQVYDPSGKAVDIFKICDEQGPEAAYKIYPDHRRFREEN